MWKCYPKKFVLNLRNGYANNVKYLIRIYRIAVVKTGRTGNHSRPTKLHARSLGWLKLCDQLRKGTSNTDMYYQKSETKVTSKRPKSLQKAFKAEIH